MGMIFVQSWYLRGYNPSRSPTVEMPSRASFSAIFGPTPFIFVTGSAMTICFLRAGKNLPALLLFRRGINHLPFLLFYDILRMLQSRKRKEV